jgi:hypothetical protein
MSAREELEKWAARFVSGVETLNFDHLLGAALTEARREHAHELAERIRQVPADLMVGQRDKQVLADLIDPEVSDG